MFGIICNIPLKYVLTRLSANVMVRNQLYLPGGMSTAVGGITISPEVGAAIVKPLFAEVRDNTFGLATEYFTANSTKIKPCCHGNGI
jgi:hypothetical protein